MLTTLDPGDTSHRWPQFLPNGRAVLFTVEKSAGVFGEASIDVITLDTKVRKTLVQGGTYGRYLPSGHILYLNGYTLLAVPFDIGRLEVTGSPLPVFDGVSASLTFGSGHFAVSSNGTLAYLPSSSAGKGKLVWVDRTGKVQLLMRTERELDFGAAENSMMRISSDGRRLALEPGNIGAYRRDVWIYEFQRDILNRLTFTEDNLYSIWSSDGRHVAFSSTRDGRALNLFWKPADGSGEAERLTRSDNLQVPYSFSPDGKWLAYFDSDPASGWDIWVLPMEGDNSSGPELRKPQVFLNSSFEETAPAFSPDGRWMAYGSDESGHEEIYVRPFPGPGARVQISSGGGRAPAWARNGRELFFSNSGKILAVSVTLSPDFRADTPTVLFEGNYHFIFDVAPDARRFAMIQFDEGESVPSTIHVVLNFFDELRRRVPTGN